MIHSDNADPQQLRFPRPSRRAFLGGLGLLGSGLALPARGAALIDTDWQEFRGPTGQGHSDAKGLPLEWGPGKNIRWRTELPGQAWSSPVVAGGRIFLTNAVVPDGADPMSVASLRVLALDAPTGKLLWDTEVFRQTDPAALRKHDKNSHASPTVIHESGRLYAHFGHHGTACLDTSGGVVWKTQEHRYPPVHGTGGSPVIVGDHLIYSADGATDPAVLALDKQSGRLKWKSPRPASAATSKFAFCTPLAITVDGRRQVITPGAGVVQSLDPTDGSEIWRFHYGTGFSVVPRPVFSHGMIFVSSGYNSPSAYAIRVGGAGDVTATHMAWTANKRIPRNSSMLVIGDELYMLDDGGIFSSRDAVTGTVHYEERLLGACSASLLHADGRIYAIDEQGKSAVVQPGKTFQAPVISALEERTLASMAVTGSDLLIRTEKAVYRVGLS